MCCTGKGCCISSSNYYTNPRTNHRGMTMKTESGSVKRENAGRKHRRIVRMSRNVFALLVPTVRANPRKGSCGTLYITQRGCMFEDSECSSPFHYDIVGAIEKNTWCKRFIFAGGGSVACTLCNCCTEENPSPFGNETTNEYSAIKRFPNDRFINPLLMMQIE